VEVRGTTISCTRRHTKSSQRLWAPGTHGTDSTYARSEIGTRFFEWIVLHKLHACNSSLRDIGLLASLQAYVPDVESITTLCLPSWKSSYCHHPVATDQSISSSINQQYCAAVMAVKGQPRRSSGRSLSVHSRFLLHTRSICQVVNTIKGL